MTDTIESLREQRDALKAEVERLKFFRKENQSLLDELSDLKLIHIAQRKEIDAYRHDKKLPKDWITTETIKRQAALLDRAREVLEEFLDEDTDSDEACVAARALLKDMEEKPK